MAKHNITLLVAIVIGLLCFTITMVFSALAATGKRKFDFYKYYFVGGFCYLIYNSISQFVSLRSIFGVYW